MRRARHIMALVMISLTLAGATAPAEARTWQVLPAADALAGTIAGASARDSILVGPGVYYERDIIIDKPLAITGTGDAVIDAGGQGQIFTVTADSVVVAGLTFRNVGVSHMEDRAGIKIVEAGGCTIENNRFIDTFFGIYLENAHACAVRKNVVTAHHTRETTSGNGIHLWYCRDVVIEDNSISGHRDGIYFEFVEQSEVRGNRSYDNLRYGMHFMFSHDDVYEGNAFGRNGAGVAVMFSDRVHMQDNEFEHNWGPASYGILLKDIRDSDIEGNRFRNNTIGLYAEGSLRLDIHRNDFRDNGYAVKIMASSYENTIRANNFIGNTFDVATNSRHNFNEFTGNYWSRYRGYDLDRDGVGDVPYRPVHLFSLLVEREPAGLVLLRSFFIDLVDAAERVVPIYTPAELMDVSPRMDRIPEVDT